MNLTPYKLVDCKTALQVAKKFGELALCLDDVRDLTQIPETELYRKTHSPY
jgi:hypothetical protein